VDSLLGYVQNSLTLGVPGMQFQSYYAGLGGASRCANLVVILLVHFCFFFVLSRSIPCTPPPILDFVPTFRGKSDHFRGGSFGGERGLC